MITFSQIKDQSSALAVEEWLKNNKATELGWGESLPPSHKSKINSAIISREESERRIAETNAKVRGNKKGLQKNAELMNMVKTIYKKALYGDISRFEKACGFSIGFLNVIRLRGSARQQNIDEIRKQLENFVFSVKKPKVRVYKPKPCSEDKLRANEVAAQRKKAAASGSEFFISVCKHHGEGRFRIRGRNPRCVKCIEIDRKKQRDRQVPKGRGDSRTQLNQQLAVMAVGSGEKFFIGTCDKHGQTKYYAFNASRNRISNRCVECRSLTNKKFRASKIEK